MGLPLPFHFNGMLGFISKLECEEGGSGIIGMSLDLRWNELLTLKRGKGRQTSKGRKIQGGRDYG